jgi:hypothetical protein
MCSIKAIHVAAAAVCALCSLTTQARAAGSDCAPVQGAVTLQSKTPFHAVVRKVASRTEASPASADQAIWIGGVLYTQMADRWLPARVAPENVLSGVTGGVTNFSACRRLTDDAIRGEPTAVYAAKMESGQAVQLWISSKSGLLLREVVDEDIMKVSADFDYANVRAPVVAR